jgi:hypothetical protein
MVSASAGWLAGNGNGNGKPACGKRWLMTGVLPGRRFCCVEDGENAWLAVDDTVEADVVALVSIHVSV